MVFHYSTRHMLLWFAMMKLLFCLSIEKMKALMSEAILFFFIDHSKKFKRYIHLKKKNNNS
jgi:hypothetical protein